MLRAVFNGRGQWEFLPRAANFFFLFEGATLTCFIVVKYQNCKLN